MSVLAGVELIKRLDHKEPDKRLVVGPMLDPKAQISHTQASVDIRLGCNFRLAIASTIGVLDEFAAPSDNHFSDLSSVYDKFYVPLGGAVTVHPHQLLLAMTLEFLRLPADLMAYVVGRSTLGRLGLIVATAVGIHPRFYGPLTLEIRNLGEAPLRLYPGQTIAQLFFHHVEFGTEDERKRDSGNKVEQQGGKLEPAQDENDKRPQYSGAIDSLPGRISDDVTTRHLKSLREIHIQAAARLRGGIPLVASENARSVAVKNPTKKDLVVKKRG